MSKNKISKLSPFFIIGLAIFLVLCTQEKSFLKNLNLNSKNEVVENDKDSLDFAVKLQQSLRNIAKSVSPAVVNIRTEKTVKVRNPFEKFFDDPLFRRFFGDPRRRGPSKRKEKSLGSGIIISPNGYIISNYHVVAGADKITIYLSDKRRFNATIIGSDEKTDIALLKVDPKGKNLPVAPLGDSDIIQVGDLAIAIGNPFGLNWTFTFGIISATGRTQGVDPNAPFKSYIQTDVSINPGNSGGPLLNIKGQVVGINSAIFSTSGGSIGIGFAIPINIAKNVIKQLIEKGKVERGYIGAYIQDVDEKLAKYYNLTKIEGVVLTDIEEGSPADKAGLKPGDIILTVNEKVVENASELISIISNIPPGKVVTLEILRNKDRKKIQVKIGKREEGVVKIKSGEPWLGMQFGSLERYRRTFNIPINIKKGVVILEVKENSAAFEVGLKPGDVIDMINNQSVANMKSLSKFVKENKDKRQFLMRIRRGTRIYFIVLENK